MLKKLLCTCGFGIPGSYGWFLSWGVPDLEVFSRMP